MTSPTLAVVTVAYNSAAMLARTLPTWSDSAEGLGVPLWLVDNSPDAAQADACRAVLDGCWPHRRVYLRRADNPGFAAAVNQAVDEVSDQAVASHVLLLNPDVWLQPDSLARIRQAIDDDPAEPLAISLRVRGRSFCGVGLSRTGVFYDLPVRPSGRAAPIGPSGGAAVFPVRLFRELKGLDETMFAWGEDADLAVRLLAGGHPCRALHLDLEHAQGHSHEGSPSGARFKTYLLCRNRIRLAARCLSGPAAALATASWLVLAFLLAPAKARAGVGGAAARGYLAGLASWPQARASHPGAAYRLRDLVRRPGSAWLPR